MDHLSEENYVPNPVLEKALDVLFLIHADHELNASCTTVLQTASSLVDPYSAVAYVPSPSLIVRLLFSSIGLNCPSAPLQRRLCVTIVSLSPRPQVSPGRADCSGEQRTVARRRK